ncbi:sensor histidine kinase [Adhaeribacter soli]|uniref:histidine kinase n=1 Tax=Adhaeribacter soli TaxID=2607655 RepID=A0A5N1J8M8_9BACT|nr:ATP-binding protein [Adhaeribacter soli]KAA9345645.1 hypothetical protein F0P94_00725 [Adhaeribacter soli]
MRGPAQEILIVIGAGTVLLFGLAVFIFLFMVLYQKKRFTHLLEKSAMEDEFNREILHSKLEVQEQTFLMISQEIHDNIGQILSLVRLNISTLDLANATKTESKISTSKELLDQAIQDLRDLSKQLNSEYLNHQHLPELLQFQLDLIRRSGVHQVNFQIQGQEYEVQQDKKLLIFRIAQEALNNAIKHASAANLEVSLNYLPEKLLLQIKDDGIGFNPQPAESSQGTGAFNLQYRAKLIGATYSINSEPSRGTRIILEIPKIQIHTYDNAPALQR